VSEGRGPGPRQLLILGLTPLVPLVGLAPGGRWILPLLAPLPLWPIFARSVRAGRYAEAFGFSMVWAVLLSASVIAFTQIAPRVAADAILHAEPYRREMFGWVETGFGKETSPARFVPEHLLHLGGFVVLTALSGGYLGLALGAALVGYMSYFVGSFAASASAPVAGALVAWVPWSVIRVLSFVALGVVLARPVLVRRAWPFGARERRWILIALVGILTDILVKTLLAPSYGRFLGSWLDAG
jgi:hypothetical protein